jgi:HAMP domain-containing protein
MLDRIRILAQVVESGSFSRAARALNQSSAASGTTAIDQEPTSEAAEEIRALAEEVRRFLNCTI